MMSVYDTGLNEQVAHAGAEKPFILNAHIVGTGVENTSFFSDRHRIGRNNFSSKTVTVNLYPPLERDKWVRNFVDAGGDVNSTTVRLCGCPVDGRLDRRRGIFRSGGVCPKFR